MPPPILTITGSDSTGLSGVQADIRTITSLGVSAATALTCLTVQTTLGIQEFFDVPASIVEGQIEAIFNDVSPQVVKVGLIRSRSVLEVVINSISRHRPRHVVYDPVFHSTQGEALVPEAVRSLVVEQLVPLCTYVIDRKNETLPNMHGMANAMASALCVYLNDGDSLRDAVQKARHYVSTRVARAMDVSSRSSVLYNDFLALLANNLHAHSDVSFYASRLNVSPRYLGQVCRKVAARSPKSIIDERLVQDIEVSLTTTTLTIQQIATQLGYSSQAHLTKFFKKMKGVAPSQYRKEKRV